MATLNSLRNPAIDHQPSRPAAAPAIGRERAFSHYLLQSALSRFTDVLAALMALFIAVQFRTHHLPGLEHFYHRHALTAIEALSLGGFGLVIYCLTGDADVHRHCVVPIWMQLRRSVGGCLIAGLLVSGALYLLQISAPPPTAIIWLVSLACVMVCLNRLAWWWVHSSRHDRRLDRRHILIIGTNRASEALRRQILSNCGGVREFKGFVRLTRRFFADDVDASHILGRLDQLRTICRVNFIDDIILAEDCPVALIMNLVDDAREMGISVFALPGIHDESGPDRLCERIGDFALIPLHLAEDAPIARAAKRACDLALSCIGLVVISPLLLVLAFAIRLDSAGPILYISKRIGRKGRAFPCFKFRTMCDGADKMKAQLMEKNERDGVLFKMANDPRVTRVGRILRKYSLDELPQIVNVIRGEMSLVGPRPPIASEVESYQVDHYRRLEVTPGLTGAWQVTARHDPSFEKYVALDIDYVKNWSFWLDMEILLKTAAVVCRGTGT
jgi:exopolysaccharide biosynthesis polyprenyl glycosylphosphotransferase